MGVTESQIKTLNPGSARFGDPGELVVQRMRFELLEGATYVDGGFGVHLNEMVVVEAASIIREGAVGDDSSNNHVPRIAAIQADSSGNKATISLMNPQTGVETADGHDLSGNKYMLEVEGY